MTGGVTGALIAALLAPAGLAAATPREWDLVLRQARSARLLARLAFLLDGEALAPPPAAARQLAAARTMGAKQDHDIRWEVGLIQKALAGLDLEAIVLLKGAAYVMADLPPARGRLFGDIDFMVPRTRLEEVEAALLAAGWQLAKDDPYDQHYYRRWTHQIPPLRHATRHSVIDLHHTIVAPTARVPVAAEALFAGIKALDPSREEAGRQPALAVLGPCDMVLHSAVHLFNDGEFSHGLRDLFDLDDLLAHFAQDPAFWPALARRADQLGLGRPLAYALFFLEALFGRSYPRALDGPRQAWLPAGPGRAVMTALLRRALQPPHASCRRAGTDFALWALDARGHYLRMPWPILLPHLLRKAWRQHEVGKRRDGDRAAMAPGGDGTGRRG